MKRKKHLVKITAATVICLTVFLAVLFGNAHISAESYSVALQNLGGPVRIVLLSDLHGKSFGRDDSRLIAKIGEQTPDVIFLDGDMIDRSADSADVQELLRLIKRLHEIAPVYFAPGNHELEYMQTDTSLLTQVAEAGAVVVNDSYAEVTLAGQPLRIGGTMGHAFYFGRSEEEFSSSPEYQFLKAFEDTDVPKICLAHMPDTFIFNGAYNLWNVDLILSGHTHGGLIRLPFIGGLYAPMQGWFPEYDQGYFRLGEHMQMVITSGLAGHGMIPRINNPPEIVVIDLVPEATQER
jgi:predicted MPP superfamily phosphohydrolase